MAIVVITECAPQTTYCEGNGYSQYYNGDNSLHIHGIINNFVLYPRKFSQQHLVDGLNFLSLFLNVLAYIINIIKELRESVEYRVRKTFVLDVVGIGDDFYAPFLNMHVNVGAGHHRVAVVVDSSRFAAVYVYSLCL